MQHEKVITLASTTPRSVQDYEQYFQSKYTLIESSDPLRLFTRRLKSTAQLSGLFMPDPNVNRETQELLERVYERHGDPNEDEMELLTTMVGITEDTVRQWCKCRQFNGTS